MVKKDLSSRCKFRKVFNFFFKKMRFYVIKRVLQFSSFSSMLTSKMRWFEIWPQKLSTTITSKVMSNLSLKIWNFKANFRSGNQLKITVVKKDLSSKCKLRRVLIFFSKNAILCSKIWKIWKSKNSVKTALTLLFKELWAIYVFFTNFKFDDFQKHLRKPTKIWTLW